MIEHYEMVSDADLITSAQLLGKSKALRFLKENREQEVATARRIGALGAPAAQARDQRGRRQAEVEVALIMCG